MKIMDKEFNYKGTWFRIAVRFNVTDPTQKLTLAHVTKKVHEVKICAWMGGFEESSIVEIEHEDFRLIEVVEGLIKDAERWVDGIREDDLRLNDVQTKLRGLGFIAKSR